MMWILWASHKRDSNGKNHVYGFVRTDHEAGKEHNIWSGFVTPVINTYIFHCECSSAYVHLQKTNRFGSGLQSLRQRKIEEGYKQITQEQIETHWPRILEEIEMLMVVRKLQNGN